MDALQEADSLSTPDQECKHGNQADHRPPVSKNPRESQDQESSSEVYRLPAEFRGWIPEASPYLSKAEDQEEARPDQSRTDQFTQHRAPRQRGMTGRTKRDPGRAVFWKAPAVA